ncbi:MAG: VanZ family protein [Deltaproteobacteria bacterium]|nr:VanZ family protein [Deltaproteobacteria bacterium]
MPAGVWAALIFWASAQSELPQPPFPFLGLDKIIHAGIYAVLAALTLYGGGWPRGRTFWLWLAVVLAYGASDEVHQMFVPGRNPDVFDWLADAVGVLTVAFLVSRAPPRAGWPARSAS